jgi:hypothetical protein
MGQLHGTLYDVQRLIWNYAGQDRASDPSWHRDRGIAAQVRAFVWFDHRSSRDQLRTRGPSPVRRVVPGGPDTRWRREARVLPVLVMVFLHSRFILARMIPAWMTGDLVPRMWITMTPAR